MHTRVFYGLFSHPWSYLFFFLPSLSQYRLPPSLDKVLFHVFPIFPSIAPMFCYSLSRPPSPTTPTVSLYFYSFCCCSRWQTPI